MGYGARRSDRAWDQSPCGKGKSAVTAIGVGFWAMHLHVEGQSHVRNGKEFERGHFPLRVCWRAAKERAAMPPKSAKRRALLEEAKVVLEAKADGGVQ